MDGSTPLLHRGSAARRLSSLSLCVALVTLLAAGSASADVVSSGAHRFRVDAVYKHYAEGLTVTRTSNRDRSHPVDVTFYCSRGIPDAPYHSNPANWAFCDGTRKPSSYTVVDQENRVFQIQAAELDRLIAQLAARDLELARMAQAKVLAGQRQRQLADIDRALERGDLRGAFRSIARLQVADTGLAAPLATRRKRAIRDVSTEVKRILAANPSAGERSAALSLLEECYAAGPSASERKLLDAASRDLIDSLLSDGLARTAGRALDTLAGAGVEGSWMKMRRAEQLVLDGHPGMALSLATPLQYERRYRVRAGRVLAEAAFRQGDLEKAVEIARALQLEDWSRSPLGPSLLGSLYRARADELASAAAGLALLEEITTAEKAFGVEEQVRVALFEARRRAEDIVYQHEGLADLARLRESAARLLAGGRAAEAAKEFERATSAASRLRAGEDVIAALRSQRLEATLAALEREPGAATLAYVRFAVEALSKIEAEADPGATRTVAERASAIALEALEPGARRLDLLQAAAFAAQRAGADPTEPADDPGRRAIGRYLAAVGPAALARLEANDLATAQLILLDATPLAAHDPAVYAAALGAGAWKILTRDPERADLLWSLAQDQGAGAGAALGRFLAGRLQSPRSTLIGALIAAAAIALACIGTRWTRRRLHRNRLLARVLALRARGGEGNAPRLLALLQELRRLGARNEEFWVLEAELRLRAGETPAELLEAIRHNFPQRSLGLSVLQLCVAGDVVTACDALRHRMEDAPLADRLAAADRISAAGGAPGLLSERGRILLLMDRAQEASAVLRRALDEEASEQAADLLVLVAYRQKDAATLARAAHSLLAMRPGDEGALVAAVRGLEELGEPRVALELLESHAPAGALADERQRLDALVCVKEVESFLPKLQERAATGDATAARQLCQAYAGLGRPGDALRALQQAVRDSAATPSDLRTMGLLYLSHAQPATAARLLKRYLDESGGGEGGPDLEAMYHLALAFEQQQLWQPALEWHQRIYEIDIDFSDVEERIEELTQRKSDWAAGPAPGATAAAAVPGAAATPITCSLCGGGNRAESQFCRDCGVTLDGVS